MAKLNKENLKVKVKNVTDEVREFVDDNKFYIGFYGVGIGMIVGGIVLGRNYNKKFEEAWRAAKQAYDNGNLDYDFGPYKVMKFFEPKTGEFIGETLCHGETVKAFIDLK